MRFVFNMKIFMLSGLIFFFGCSRTHKGSETNHDLITINIDSLKQDNESMVITGVNYIPLETSEQCLISYLSKVLYFDNKFYISNFYKEKAIFVFARDGKFLNKIGREGRGPMELEDPVDFDIDEKGHVYIYDNSDKKIIVYTSQGDKLNEFDVPLRFFEFFFIGNGKGFFRNGHKDELLIPLGMFDAGNNSNSTILAPRKGFDDFSIVSFSERYFFKSAGTVLYNQRFTGKIFRLSKDGTAKEVVRIEPENYFPDEKAVSDINDANYSAVNGPVTINLSLKESLQIEDIRDIYENSGSIFLHITKRFGDLFCVISKSTGSTICFTDFDKKQFLDHLNILGVADDMFLSVISSSMYLDEDWAEKVEKLSIPETEKAKLRSLSATDNPTLVLLKFK
jgi:hypothetical protein